MWSMPVVLTEWENENDSANQNDAAKMTLQKLRCQTDVAKKKKKKNDVTWRQLLYSVQIL